MLTVSNLSKRYGNVLALQNVSFHIDGQESAAVFGMAGSGKSTLASLLSGFLECSPGQIRIGSYDMGKAAEKARGLIGYLPEGNPLYGDMSVYEYLEFICSLYKVALKKRRAQKRVRESGYAASVVATMLNSVPAAVYRMVFPYLSHRSGWFKTCS